MEKKKEEPRQPNKQTYTWRDLKTDQELDDDGIPMPRQFEEAIDTTTITEITSRMRDRDQLGQMFQAMGEAFGTKEKNMDKNIERWQQHQETINEKMTEWREVQASINEKMVEMIDGLSFRLTKLENVMSSINDFLEAKEKEDSA